MFLKLANLTLWGYGLQSPLKCFILINLHLLRYNTLDEESKLYHENDIHGRINKGFQQYRKQTVYYAIRTSQQTYYTIVKSIVTCTRNNFPLMAHCTGITAVSNDQSL